MMVCFTGSNFNDSHAGTDRHRRLDERSYLLVVVCDGRVTVDKRRDHVTRSRD